VSPSLQIVPQNVLSYSYDVLLEGAAFGRIENRPFFLLERATLWAGEAQYAARREGLFHPRYLLETAGGVPRARAEKSKIWHEEYRVDFDGRTLTLSELLFRLKGVFVVSDSSGQIGSIAQQRMVSRRLLVEFPVWSTAPPMEVTIFLGWIALMIQRRRRVVGSS
jgi:hypothetical protein